MQGHNVSKIMKRENIPNIITGLRLSGIPFLFYLIWSQRFGWALVLTLVMSLSDAVDGYIAKRFKWQSRFGAFFDPLADKLMSLVAFITLAAIGMLPWWFAIFILTSVSMLISGGIVFYFYVQIFCVKPPLISKLNTLLQWVLVVMILGSSSAGMSLTNSPLVNGLMGIITLCTIASVYIYIRECQKHIKGNSL